MDQQPLELNNPTCPLEHILQPAILNNQTRMSHHSASIISNIVIQGQGAPVHQLAIREVFDHLSERERLYTHHLSRAAWHGTRIIMCQVSLEAILIFDFILELRSSCDGQWSTLVGDGGATETELSAFLDYAALFLSNLGNYFVSESTLRCVIVPV